MPHLDTDRLAALGHEAPTEAERAHLAACAACRAERDAYAALAALAAASRMPGEAAGARLTEWAGLAERLRAEGLLGAARPDADGGTAVAATVTPLPVAGAAPDAASAPRSHVAAGRRTGGRRVTAGPARPHGAWRRAAAAVALLVLGAGVGRWSAGAPLMPTGAAGAELATAAAGDAADAGRGVDGGAGDGFASVEAATDALVRAQRDYERASLWLAANDPAVHSSDVYRARLAALDRMMAASRAALLEVPQDPVLNQYYLAAWTAREATLQQLGGVLPVDKTLDRY